MVQSGMKNLCATTFELGENCRCFWCKCFQVISPKERQRIISNFYSLGDYNKQSQHLSGLITVVPVQQRQNKKDDTEASNHDYNY